MTSTAIRNTESYDYSLIRKRQEQVTGETGSLSIALANNLASRKSPTFFLQTKEDKVLELQAIDEARLVNREGKTTYLTKRQQKLVYALSMFLSQSKDEPEIRAYVQALKDGKHPKSRITLPISITLLTKLVTVDGYARKKQKEDVLSDLKAMADIKQVQIFGEYGTNEGQLRFVASLISISEQIEDLSKDKELDSDFIAVTFGSIFFYELYNKYAIIKPSLFQLWGKSGNGTDTELFAMLLSDLLAKYSFHRIASRQAGAKVKKDKYKTDESLFKARKKAQRDALTYSEYTSTIQERVVTGYSKSREQKRRFVRDLNGAIRALIQYGLLTDETRITKTDKGDRVDFVFNIDYDKQDETVQALPGITITRKDTESEEKIEESSIFVDEERTPEA